MTTLKLASFLLLASFSIGSMNSAVAQAIPDFMAGPNPGEALLKNQAFPIREVSSVLSHSAIVNSQKIKFLGVLIQHPLANNNEIIFRRWILQHLPKPSVNTEAESRTHLMFFTEMVNKNSNKFSYGFIFNMVQIANFYIQRPLAGDNGFNRARDFLKIALEERPEHDSVRKFLEFVNSKTNLNHAKLVFVAGFLPQKIKDPKKNIFAYEDSVVKFIATDLPGDMDKPNFAHGILRQVLDRLASHSADLTNRSLNLIIGIAEKNKSLDARDKLKEELKRRN